jgi:uncharacterized RDD family membrane protein YckC
VERDMSVAEDRSHELAAQPLYARFSRRLRGIFIDWALTLVVIFGALTIAAALRNDGASRALGIAAVAILALYEPVLVSRTGGTIGHHLTNLRVVDEVTGGNVSFLKAIARVVVKGLLGWYSFLAMAFTRRNQAVHDPVTQSTVQVRDRAKASAGQFVPERTELTQSDMPSPLRRIVVILAYMLLMLAISLGIEQVIIQSGAVSMECVDSDVCTPVENVVTIALGGGFLVTCVACAILGWRAKLFGARKA